MGDGCLIWIQKARQRDWRDGINSSERGHNSVICPIQHPRGPHSLTESERGEDGRKVWVHRMCSLFVRFNAVLQYPHIPLQIRYEKEGGNPQLVSFLLQPQHAYMSSFFYTHTHTFIYLHSNNYSPSPITYKVIKCSTLLLLHSSFNICFLCVRTCHQPIFHIFHAWGGQDVIALFPFQIVYRLSLPLIPTAPSLNPCQITQLRIYCSTFC